MGAGPARPQHPGRPRRGSPPPRACFCQGTVSALSQAARETTGLSGPSNGGAREASMSSRAGPALGPRDPLTSPSGSELEEPRSKLPAPAPQPVRRTPAHFAPEADLFRLDAS